MAMLPTSESEISNMKAGDRSDFDVVYMQMPFWWTEWYSSLSKEDKFRFGRVVEKRLRSIGLIGGII